MNKNCVCTGPGFCSRHKIDKTSREFDLCKGVADTPDGGFKYWKAWDGGGLGATAPDDPQFDPKVFRGTGKRKSRGPGYKSTVRKKKTRKKPPAYGPGTELKKLLSKIGIKSTSSCPCNQIAAEMDKNGPKWCEKNIESIADQMSVEAKKRKLPFLRIAARKMVRIAISRSRKKAKIDNESLKFSRPVTRNLIMHIYPIKGNGVWQWNVAQIMKRIDLFNGKRIVAIVTDRTTDSVEDVKAAFNGKVKHFIVNKNNPRHGEYVSFSKLLSEVKSTNKNEVTFYCHAKGVSPGSNGVRRDRSMLKLWAESMYETCLDYWPIVQEMLSKRPMAGSFRKHQRLGKQLNKGWFYSGTFYWFRNDAVFSRNWSSVEKKFWAAESWPGSLFEKDEVAVIVGDNVKSLYQSIHWKSLNQEIEKFKAAAGRFSHRGPADVTLITPTGDRHEAFRLCEKWMGRQDFTGSVQWIVVDDGRRPTPMTRGQQYIRIEPTDKDPKHTLSRNLRAAIPHVRGEKVLIIEDDEWYSPGYVGTMSGLLDQHELAGHVPARYYYVRHRAYRELPEHRHASLCRTGIRKIQIADLASAARNDHPSVDMRLWKDFRGNKHREPGEPLVVGIKGMPGRRQGGRAKAGMGESKRPKGVTEDASLSVLRDWIGDDVRSYYPYIAKDAGASAGKITVYTAIFGQYDSLRNPLVVNDNCDYVCFTDNPVSDRTLIWDQRKVERKFDDPSKENRWYKMNSHNLFPDSDLTIYLDGQLRLLRDPTELIAECEHYGDHDLYLFDHHERSCLYHEAAAVKRIRFDSPSVIDNAIGRYRAAGFPEKAGLHLGGMLIRRKGCELFNEMWWNEYLDGSRRDQISLPYVLKQSGIDFRSLPALSWEHFFRRENHRKPRPTFKV